MQALPHKTMRHTRSSALRYQRQAMRKSGTPQSRQTMSRTRDNRASHSKTAPLPAIGHVNPTVMSLDEFGHCVTLANKHKYQSQDAYRKATLREKSKARYQNWGNTLEALRERKKNDRVKRMEEVERRQQIIDEQEAEYQQGLQRAAIERANQILYTQNDRVKNFQKGLIYSNVLQAREAQKRITKRSKQAEVEEENMWFQRQMDDLKVKVEKEKKDDAARKRKSDSLAKMQLQQLAEMRARNARARQEEIEEGDRIREAAALAAEQARQAEHARMLRMKENQLEYKRANEMQKRLKEEQARFEQLEEEQMVALHKEKERQTEERKAWLAERKRKKDAMTEKMLKRQYDYLLNIKNEEESRLAAEADELEKKTEMFQARKEAQRALNLKETQASRKKQIERKKRELDRQKEEEQIMVQNWERRRQQMDKLELHNEAKTIENAKELKAYLRQQIAVKETEAKSRRQEELAFMHYQHDLRRREDAVFNEYTRAHIEDFRNRGQSTKPMEILLIKEQIRNIRAM